MSSEHPPGHEVIAVQVPGGRLAVETFTPGTEPVLAIHGISSQRRLWDWLRAADPGLSLVAPDLRGRGDSVGRRRPFAPRAGTPADLSPSCSTTSAWPPCTSCGMSMGGFVAVELADGVPGPGQRAWSWSTAASR